MRAPLRATVNSSEILAAVSVERSPNAPLAGRGLRSSRSFHGAAAPGKYSRSEAGRVGRGKLPVGSAGAKPGVSIPGEADSSPHPVGTPGETRNATPEATPAWEVAPSPAPRGRVGEGAALAPAPASPILPTPPMAPVQRQAEITVADVVPSAPAAPHPPAPSPIALPSPGRGGELVAGAVGVDGMDGVQRRTEVAVDPVRFAPGPAVNIVGNFAAVSVERSSRSLAGRGLAPAVPSMVQRRPESTVDPKQAGWAGKLP